MTTGKGAAASSSNKMKCKHDSDVVWIRYFVECQEYDIDECIIYQDNKSALSLEKNGCISSSKQTKHVSRRNTF